MAANSVSRNESEPRSLARLTWLGLPSEVSRQVGEALVDASPDFVKIGCAWAQDGVEAHDRVARHQQERTLEHQPVERAVLKRRLEFITGRELARAVMKTNSSIGRGPMGEPIWPEGVVGSISHSHGLVVLALADSTACRALGVDLEPDQPLAEDIAEIVARPDEIQSGDRRLFVAKEAYYKAHFGLHHRFLEFEDVRVEDSGEGRWRAAEIASGLAVTPMQGRWIRVAGWLAALCWLGWAASNVLAGPEALDRG